MDLRRILLPVAVLLVAPATLASTIGVQDSPTLDIVWKSGTNPSAEPIDVGTVEFTVDEEGNFIASGVTGSNCEIDSELGTVTCLWGTTTQDVITIDYAYGNLDPFMNFALGVVDAGAASNFSFNFTSPIAPTINGLVNYQLDLSGSFSNGSPNDGGSIAMAAPNTLGVLDGVLNATTIAGIGGGASFPSGGNSIYGPFVATGTYDCSLIGGCTSMDMNLSFLGSGSFDAYSFTGRFEITEVVPVPAAAWLLGSALGVLGFLRRRGA